MQRRDCRARTPLCTACSARYAFQALLRLRCADALPLAWQLAARLPHFRPATMLDFGSGPGTASLAVASLWPASLRESVAVEVSRDMLELADVLRESMNAPDTAEEPDPAADSAAWPRDAVPPSRVVPHMSRLNGRQQRRHYDIVVAAYSLGELPSEVRSSKRCMPPHCLITPVPPSTGRPPADCAASVVSRLRHARHRGARHTGRLGGGSRGAQHHPAV